MKAKYAVCVFIGLKKAFDTIQHAILISKMYYYGVRGVALVWLCSYLYKRQQYIKLGHINDNNNIKCCAPQGCALGPKVFILFINNICDVSKFLHLVLFH